MATSDKTKLREGKSKLQSAFSDLQPSVKLEIEDGKVVINELTLFDKFGKPTFIINDVGEVFGYADENAKEMTPITEKELKEEYYYW